VDGVCDDYARWDRGGWDTLDGGVRMLDYSVIGKNLLKYRKDEGLSQAKLAKESGISTTAYRAIETGKAMPRVNTLLAICNVLGVKIQDVCSPVRKLENVKWN